MDAPAAAAEAFAEDELPTRSDGPRLVYDRSAVRLRSPLPRPNSIRDCRVYEDHLLNTRDLDPGALREVYYEYPVYYKGNPDAVVHPGETVPWPRFTDRLDVELEIAAVVGTRGRDVDPSDAMDHIAGLTIFNDFSARDVQAAEKPLKLGPSKSKDFANGFGPCLVTADSIDPTDLRTEVRVNGETWAENTTDGMYHSWEEIVAHVSEGITIHPATSSGAEQSRGGAVWNWTAGSRRATRSNSTSSPSGR